MPRHNTHTVTLPAVAAQAAHEVVDDKFTFSPTNAHGPPLEVPPVTLPDGAMVPEHSPPNGMLPDGAAAMVPVVIPPQGMGQPDLPDDVPWWLV